MSENQEKYKLTVIKTNVLDGSDFKILGTYRLEVNEKQWKSLESLIRCFENKKEQYQNGSQQYF